MIQVIPGTERYGIWCFLVSLMACKTRCGEASAGGGGLAGRVGSVFWIIKVPMWIEQAAAGFRYQLLAT